MMLRLQATRRRLFRHDCTGTTSIEYGIIASLVGAVIVGAVTGLGESVAEMYETIAAAFN